jgi:hypothetical protein
LVPVLESLEERLAPAVFLVTSLADSNASSSGSLRRAIADSNNTAGPNQIHVLTPGTYDLTIAGVEENADVTGDLDIVNQDVTIDNQSGGTVVINQTTNDRVFDVSPSGVGIHVTITGVTIQGGQVTGESGGGIRVSGPSGLILTNDLVQKNSADNGGGIDTYNATLNIYYSLIAGNSATDTRAGQGGGGLFIDGVGQVTIGGSEFTGNSAASDGGGILNDSKARLNISGSTFNKNLAGLRWRARLPERGKLRPHRRHPQRQQRHDRRGPRRHRPGQQFPSERHHCFQLGHDRRRHLRLRRRAGLLQYHRRQQHGGGRLSRRGQQRHRRLHGGL